MPLLLFHGRLTVYFQDDVLYFSSSLCYSLLPPPLSTAFCEQTPENMYIMLVLLTICRQYHTSPRETSLPPVVFFFYRQNYLCFDTCMSGVLSPKDSFPYIRVSIPDFAT